MKVIKNISFSSIIWLVLFVIDYIIELFQIDASGTVVTVMGLKIVTKMTPTSLNSDFSITGKAVIIYVIFILLWLMISAYYKKFKKQNEH